MSKKKKVKKVNSHRSKWRSICSYIKKHYVEAIVFVVGVIVTLILTKVFNSFLPDPPIVVEKVPDTLQVVHVYEQIPDSILKKNMRKSEALIEEKLRKKMNENRQTPKPVKGACLLSSDSADMEKQSIVSTDTNMSNGERERGDQVSLNKVFQAAHFPNAKGYSIKSSVPYFFLKMSPQDDSYVDFTLNFFDERVLEDIYCLSIKICIVTNGTRNLILDANYEKGTGRKNIIRLKNIFRSAEDYEIQVGFFQTKDINAQYPDFYREIRRVNNRQKQ